jgi:tryptophan halogenase
MSEKELSQFLGGLRKSISETVARLPSQEEFINRYCKASVDAWEAPPRLSAAQSPNRERA